MLRVPVKRLAHGADLELPTHATMDSAGMDLRAAVEAYITLPPGGRSLIPTGIALALPSGYEGQVRPRSSLAWKHGVAVLNSPGTVDADYRGELSVLLINHGDEPFIVRRGERIAQLVIAPVITVALQETGNLPGTDRGKGGFGSTGIGS